MPLLNDATKLYLGTQTVTAAYKAGVKVWPKPVVNTLGATLTKTTDPNAQITTSFSGTTPTTYRYYSSTNGAAWVYRLEGGPGPYTFDTTYSSTFVMKVDSFDAAGNGLASATTNTVTMGARPLVNVQRFWQGSAVESATYRDTGANRNVGQCYYGRFDATWGMQKSLARWEIPVEIRNCVSIESVELSWYNLHHFLNSGGKVSVVVHHYHGSLGGSFPGSTAPLRNPQVAGDPIVEWSAPKPGWINGTDWFHVGWLHAADRPNVAEEIRTQNLAGFGLVALDSSQNRYGYGNGVSQPLGMRINYTVAV